MKIHGWGLTRGRGRARAGKDEAWHRALAGELLMGREPRLFQTPLMP